MDGLESQIKAEALRLGFDLVGITGVNPPQHLATFEAWLQAGRHGTMQYLETDRSRQRRADPPAKSYPNANQFWLLPGIIPTPPSLPTSENEALLNGKVAAYAGLPDYHDWLPARLQELVQFLETQTGKAIPNRIYTDSGPILERDLAQRAGLGWIGKNTCLIHPHHGSYFLLGEVLLGLPLTPDEPFTADRCGNCHRCLDACPTACILPDRTLDARRCISYLTIELKAAIPVELRSQIGSWIFGCDICQQVCPWNLRFAPSPQPAPAVAQADLMREIALTQDDFNQKFSPDRNNRSPIKRTKRRGYLRNVAIALGNSGNPATVTGLSTALRSDPEPLVRAHAAWALGVIQTTAARQTLRAAAIDEKEESVLLEIRAALDTGNTNGDESL